MKLISIKKFKKSFTLVELLAVIVILGIILAIAIPAVTGLIENSQKGAMESGAKLVLKAIDLKIAEDENFNPLSYNNHTEDLLSSLNLSNENYESISLIKHEGVLYIKIVGKNKWQGLTACGSYHVMNAGKNSCGLDFEPPVISLIGGVTIEIDYGSTFIDPGVNITDNSGEIIEPNITGNVNTSISGNYTLTYTATDSNGNTSSIMRTVHVKPVVYTFNYTGNYQTVTLRSGTYIFELWGAKGGDYVYGTYNYPGGKGGYSKGTITVNTDTTIYLYVGGAGKGGSYTQYQGGWNGGGTAASGDIVSYSGGGGGATDVRLVSGIWNNATSLASRIMVAGGGSGGGGSYYSRYFNVGVNGGGVTGENGTGIDCCNTYHGAGGTQSTGNALGVGCSTNYFGRSGAGGGYYGGMCLAQGYGSSGGGSGFVPGHPGVATQSNGYTFTNTVMTNGVNQGDGKVVITGG